ncbi:hypothetical protein ABZS66_25750 [Dactylosporangium sp. NPDC005572]|uniref:hypothetical protein n=1 Tax=Dactylosporangium sp. NPDC005572 TaxID=3156889 RepID=UPI0033A43CB6
MKKTLIVIGTVFGLYLIVRAIAEPFVIDFDDPATYSKDWGGPSLAGVLLVHCGPGVLSAVLIGWALARRRRTMASSA